MRRPATSEWAVTIGVVMTLSIATGAAAPAVTRARDTNRQAVAPSREPDLLAFKTFRERDGVTLRFAHKRRTTIVRLVGSHTDEARLTIPVSHLHQLGVCHGGLTITLDRILYESESGDHRMSVPRHSAKAIANYRYALGSTIELTPRGSHRRRFQVDCLIRGTRDTTGFVKTCGATQDAVVALAASAFDHFQRVFEAAQAEADR